MIDDDTVIGRVRGTAGYVGDYVRLSDLDDDYQYAIKNFLDVKRDEGAAMTRIAELEAAYDADTDEIGAKLEREQREHAEVVELYNAQADRIAELEAQLAKAEAALRAAELLRNEVAGRDNDGCHYDGLLRDFDQAREAMK